MKTLIKNAQIINENRVFKGSLLIENQYIAEIFVENQLPASLENMNVIDASGKWLLPGAIDDQVHFREPGLTGKGSIASESRAAAAGGVTSFMDMPNTIPQTLTLNDLEWKFQRASETSLVNYSFFFGGSNTNFNEISKLDAHRVPGIKLFLGSSTGDMLVDQKDVLKRFFSETNLLIAVHAESESIIQRNKAQYINKLGADSLDITYHSKIRDEEACYSSSAAAVELATSLNTRLHLLHISTSKELSLLNNGIPLKDKRITGETCVHFLWFTDQDYSILGNKIKWNPSIKTIKDREALREAVNNNLIDIVATDHAPHLLSDKEGNCLTAASGAPMVQHSLIAMLELAYLGVFTIEKVVQKMSHDPAELFKIDRRGYVRPGYFADLVLIDPDHPWIVKKDNIFYKCGWSPMEGQLFHRSVWKTFVNGQLAYSDGVTSESMSGMELLFNKG